MTYDITPYNILSPAEAGHGLREAEGVPARPAGRRRLAGARARPGLRRGDRGGGGAGVEHQGRRGRSEDPGHRGQREGPRLRGAPGAALRRALGRRCPLHV